MSMAAVRSRPALRRLFRRRASTRSSRRLAVRPGAPQVAQVLVHVRPPEYFVHVGGPGLDSGGVPRIQAKGPARVRFGQCFLEPGALSDRYRLVVAREGNVA